VERHKLPGTSGKGFAGKVSSLSQNLSCAITGKESITDNGSRGGSRKDSGYHRLAHGVEEDVLMGM